LVLSLDLKIQKNNKRKVIKDEVESHPISTIDVNQQISNYYNEINEINKQIYLFDDSHI
jgi:hypothetical protein